MAHPSGYYCYVKEIYNCKYCPKSCLSVQALHCHELLHTSPYKCKLCQAVLSSQRKLDKHLKKTHLDRDIAFMGSDCDNSVTESHYLDTAKVNMCTLKHEYNEKFFSERLNNAQNFALDIKMEDDFGNSVTKSHFLDTENVNVCTVKKEYNYDEAHSSESRNDAQNNALGIKMGANSKKGNKKLKRRNCRFCAETFDNKGLWRIHENIVHFGKQKFACHYCDYSFPVRDLLHTHLQETHPMMFIKHRMRKEKVKAQHFQM